MTVTGTALRMRLALKNLCEKHKVSADPCLIPLTAPVDGDLIVEGFAVTSDLDGDRTRFRKYAFGYPLLFRHGYPPLLVRHDPQQIAGVIDELAYDLDGRLLIAATLTHPLAKRMGAFSISAKVNEYEIKDADTPDFHAIINNAEISEISLTDRPSNPEALVMFRHPASSLVKQYELLIQKVDCLSAISKILQQQQKEYST